ncbi:hypothetical protein [Halorubrum ezzemoulense]|nr:hypothetical protein [Halorubrum ezzemoulense]
MRAAVKVDEDSKSRLEELRRIKEKPSRFSAGMNPTILYSNHELLAGCFN